MGGVGEGIKYVKILHEKHEFKKEPNTTLHSACTEVKIQSVLMENTDPHTDK